jgi:hypothetical protein
MLTEECFLCWWQIFQKFLATAEELKPGFMYSFQSTAFVVYHNKLFIDLHMLRLLVEHNTFGSLASVSVRPEVFCHTDQVVFFPHPRMCDSVSQPVKCGIEA